MNEPLSGRATGDTHDEWDELSAAYALHALEPGDEHRFVRHLGQCARCARSVRDFNAVVADLAAAVDRDGHVPIDMPDFPAPSFDTVLARIAGESPGSAGDASGDSDSPAASHTGHAGPAGHAVVDLTAARTSRAARLRRSVTTSRAALLVAAAAAAVLVLPVGGVAAWRSLRDGSPSTVQALLSSCSDSSGCQTVQLSDSHGATVATAVVRGDHVRVVSHGLSANDPRRNTYVLWQMSRSGAPVGLTAFDVSSGGSEAIVASTDLHDGLGATLAFGISREQGSSIPALPSTVIATGATGA